MIHNTTRGEREVESYCCLPRFSSWKALQTPRTLSLPLWTEGRLRDDEMGWPDEREVADADLFRAAVGCVRAWVSVEYTEEEGEKGLYCREP